MTEKTLTELNIWSSVLEPENGLFAVDWRRPQLTAGDSTRDKVLNELRAGLESLDTGVVTSSLDALSVLGDRSTLTRAAVLSRSASPLVAAYAVSMRLRAGDPAAFVDAVALIEGASKIGTAAILHMLLSARHGGNELAHAIPISELNRVLVTAENDRLIRYVADTLSKRKNRTSVPFLMLCMLSPAKREQARCHVALTRAVSYSGIGLPDYDREPKRTVERWRRWWALVGSELYGPLPRVFVG